MSEYTFFTLIVVVLLVACVSVALMASVGVEGVGLVLMFASIVLFVFAVNKYCPSK